MRTFLHLTRTVARVAFVLLGVAIAHAVFTRLFDLTAAEGVLLANTFATPNWVMRKVARRLVNNAVFASRSNVMREYDDEYAQRGAKMGDTITLRLPQRYEVTVGATMNPTPLNDQTVTLSITDQSNIGMEYDTWAATLQVDDFMNRYGDPAVDQLVNNIDFTGLSRMYKAVAKTTGTPGVVPATSEAYTQAKVKLIEAAVPRPYRAFLTADAHAQIAREHQSLFNPSAQVSAFFREGQFNGPALGISEWFEDENIANHTVGALGGTPLVVGAGQSGSSINIDGATAGVTGYWKEGDTIQFASCQEINPMSRQSTNRNKDFVVTEDVNTDGSGLATIPISPATVLSGPFRNVDEAPGDNDAVTTFGHASNYAGVSTRMGLVYNKEAFALVMADLVLPRGLWISERINNAKLGVSIRMLKDHQIVDDVSPTRLDTAHGWGAIRQELASKVCM
jgi:hypothetical protein